MLINFNLDSIKPIIINYSTIELSTTYIMKAGHTLAVFLLWMGSLHTVSSMDMTSDRSKKPDHGQRRSNKWDGRRVERSVLLLDLTLTSDNDDGGGGSTNRNTAVQAPRAVQPAINQQAVRVRMVFGLRQARRRRQERGQQNIGTSPRRQQNRKRGWECGGANTITQHGTSTATERNVISLLTSDEEPINENNNADANDNSCKDADPPTQRATPNEHGHREQNQTNAA